MANSIKKQTILITGCTHGGIGYATAKKLKTLGPAILSEPSKPLKSMLSF
jgi:short-subunit dehydrogenase involved in D-alanine esterification of teichoic acids